MNSNRSAAIAAILREEGGYVDHPSDPGGATNKGITLSSYRRYVNPSGTKEDLKKLTVGEAEAVYAKQFWAPVMGDDLPAGLDLAVFDFAVNSGPRRAIRYLQELLGDVEVDGAMGPQTLASVNRIRSIPHFIDAYMAKRDAFLRKLKTWKVFGKGWSRRLTRISEEAHKMYEDARDARDAQAAMVEMVSNVASKTGGLIESKPAVKSITVWGIAGTITAAVNLMAQRGINPLEDPVGFMSANVNELAIIGTALVSLWGRLRAKYVIE